MSKECAHDLNFFLAFIEFKDRRKDTISRDPGLNDDYIFYILACLLGGKVAFVIYKGRILYSYKNLVSSHRKYAVFSYLK